MFNLRILLFQRKTLLLIVAVSTLIFLGTPGEAHAGFLLAGLVAGTVGLGLLGFFKGPEFIASQAMNIVEAILRGLVEISSALVDLSSKFFTYVLVEFNTKAAFFDNPFVQQGWSMVRDIANWFFVVGLLVISTATVLGIETYGIRRLLPRLIIVALLINFSLLISGIIVNVSQLFMGFFIKESAGTYGDIGTFFANSGFGYNELKGTDLITGLQKDIAEVANLFFKMALQLFIAYIFLFLSVLFVIRIAILWVQMILSPLAFAASILPRTQQFANEWWNNFLNWNIFGVIALFFIWLGGALISYIDSAGFDADFRLLTESGTNALAATAALLLRYVSITIFFILAMGVAKKMAGQAASLAQNVIAAGGGAALAAGVLGLRGAGYAARRAAVHAPPERVKQMAERLRRIPILRRIPQEIERARAREAEIAYERTKRRFANMTPEQLKRIAPTLAGPESAIVQDMLAEHNIVGKETGISEAQRKLNIEELFRLGRARRVSVAEPHFARQALKMNQERLNQLMSTITPKGLATMRHEALADEMVLNAVKGLAWAGKINEKHLRAIAEEGSAEFIKEFNEKIFEQMKTGAIPVKPHIENRIKKWLNSPQGRATPFEWP